MKSGFIKIIKPFLLLVLTALVPFNAAALAPGPEVILLKAARVFDGNNIRTGISVLVKNGKVLNLDTHESIKFKNARVIDLGDATILPGFIELHAHISFQNVPADVVLKHGVTTVRDLGGPVHKPTGGKGSLRVLTSGLIITAPNGYPIPNMGAKNIALAVSTVEEARKAVRNLISEGAVVIKVALEPGGEVGAPWSSSHGHGNHHKTKVAPDHQHRSHSHSHSNKDSHLKPAWPLLPTDVVKAIVDEAHKNNLKVTAHVAEKAGVQIALDSGIDEWAHVPCEVIPEPLLKRGVLLGVKIVSTLDTLSKCSGVKTNAGVWTSLGGELLYGAETAHPDIPWGIDAQELIYMMQMAKLNLIDTLRAATSKAGQHLNIPLLGTLQPGAPADIIAVKGNPTHNLKLLEYPDLVISGGEVIVNNF